MKSYRHTFNILLIISFILTLDHLVLMADPSQGNYIIDIINSDKGLPSDDVRKVFQDSQGFIWFCTTEGLIRYDGYELKTFSISRHHDRGLITNTFNDIDEDSLGYLWCATDRGVARLDLQNETFTFYNTQTVAPFRLSYDLIYTLVVDEKNHVWLGSSGAGVEVMDPQKGIIASYNISRKETGMNSDWITLIYRDHKENIWIGSWRGALTVVNPSRNILKSWTKEEIPYDITHFSPISMVQSSDNDYWLGLWGNGIFKFSFQDDSLIIDQHILLESNNESDVANIIFDLCFDKENNLWVGTPLGLHQFQNPNQSNPSHLKFSTETTGRTLSHNEAFTILCDASGLIWVGTSGGGINKIDSKLKLFNTLFINRSSDAPISQSVTAFTQTPDGRLLIGVRSMGFGQYNLNDQSFTRFSQLPEFNQLPSDLNTVNCFLWDSKGYLWLGTRYMGLIKVNPQTGEHLIINKNIPQYSFPSREIYDLQEDSLGFIWVGTENGLYKIVPGEPANFRNFFIIRYATEEDNETSLSSNRISKILIDHNGHLWVATFDGGLNWSSSDIKNHYPLLFQRFQAAQKERNGLITDHILTLFEDAKQNIWIGSGGGGLFKWTPANQRFLSYAPYVSGDIIYAIKQDNDNNLWIGTNRGLTRMAITSDSIRSNYFLKENGLQGNIFNKGAAFKDNRGNLCFGGNHGFNYFNPEDIDPNSFIPPVVITEVKVMNVPVSGITTPDRPLILNHLKNSFSVTFAALSYSQPENNKYAVRLEGLEERWRILNADMRTLNYANLKPGDYTLKIKGSNSQGHWNPKPEQLFIKVKPAPYKTWWAFSFYALIFGSFILLIFLMERKNQKVKHALEMEHLERQKSDKLNKFKQSLFANISHEFLTPLSILSFLIEDWKQARTSPLKKDLILAQRNIHRLNKLNRQFLYYSKAEVEKLPLSVSAGNLKLFTQNICDNFIPLARKNQIEFHCEISCPETNLWFDQEKLDIILYNILSNAFKFTPGEGTITLSLILKKTENKTLACFEIKDTGPGISYDRQKQIFNRYQSVNNTPEQPGGFGIGLTLTKSMVEAHKGFIKLTSKPGEGTTVAFSIPVNKKAFEKNEITEISTQKEPDYFMEPDEVEEETLLRIKNLQKTFDNKPGILIVEDNADLRKILKGSLESYFTVMEAPNGLIGYETAVNKKPNLIISDVLMPAMNGLEMCRKIKKNKTTSHISVILLTAKISEEDRTQGYRAQADSYITKPFSLNTLLARIEALLAKQQRTLSPKATLNNTHTNNQNDFLTRARKIIDQNLSNPDFSVKMLAEELSISQSMLYRKTSELLNINPNTFIRKMKMMKARELLEENTISISEVAFRCGFKDVSYFGTSFKKEFGMTPSQYQKKRLG